VTSSRRRDRSQFATTRWSVVLAAAGDAASREALATLCENYWYPLYAYLRRQGQSPEDAQDLVQGFFARVLEKDALSHVDPARGRFRSFMLASLKHYVSNERVRASAQKRGGPLPPLPFEVETAEGQYRLEPRDDTTPETLFDRRWALTLLARVLTTLRAEFQKAGKERLFDRLKGFLTAEDMELSYREIGAELGLSEGAVKVTVHRLRRRFRTLLQDEIAETVTRGEDVEDEIQYLFRALQS
jgi:RNA polymerase sigma-70 factor (ECF subfamily)